MDPNRIVMRPAGADNFEFLWRLQCEAMRPNVERQFGAWDEAFQRELFEKSTDPLVHEIIELDHEPSAAVLCQAGLPDSRKKRIPRDHGARLLNPAERNPAYD